MRKSSPPVRRSEVTCWPVQSQVGRDLAVEAALRPRLGAQLPSRCGCASASQAFPGNYTLAAPPLPSAPSHPLGSAPLLPPLDPRLHALCRLWAAAPLPGPAPGTALRAATLPFRSPEEVPWPLQGPNRLHTEAPSCRGIRCRQMGRRVRLCETGAGGPLGSPQASTPLLGTGQTSDQEQQVPLEEGPGGR